MSYKLIKLKEIDSTHKLALRLIEGQSTFECVITADTQTDGVGRCGRKWESRKGNFFTSIVRKLPTQVDITQLSLAVATVVFKVLEDILPENLKNNLYLHWPNDIYYKNRKISGILLAVVDEWIVISIGINIHSVSTSTAVGLDEIISKVVVTRKMILSLILNNIEQTIVLLRDNHFEYVKNFWLTRMIGIDSDVTIKNGKSNVSGIIKGIDDSGRLILNCNGKMLYISSGDMFLNEDRIMVNYG